MSYYLTNENSFLNINNAHLKVSGNVHADVMKIGAVEFAPMASNVTTTTNFTNVETGLTTSSNLHVGGTLTMGTVEVIATTHNLENTTTNGNITPHTVEFTNATTSIVASGNVEVEKELSVSGNVAVSENLTVSSNLTVSGDTFITTGAIPRAVGGTPTMGTNLSVTGSVVTNVGHPGSYKVHTFNSSGTLNVDYPGLTADVLMIGGGGGGGYNHAGAGGGGGYLETRMFISGGIHNIVIGAGGAAPVSTSTPGTTGNDTYAFGIIAAGGGGGGSGWAVQNPAGQPGASGGGGSGGNNSNGLANDRHSSSPGYVVSVPGYNPYVNRYQGGNGGQGNGTALAGGGGGGAGGHGQNASGTGAGNSFGGNGGNGIDSYISGTSISRGGGGGGGAWNGTGGTGQGGGGNGHVATDGTINTGGGGGGGGNAVSDGGTGGSGVVIIRYLIPT